MKNRYPTASKLLKHIRTTNGFTQDEFSNELGLDPANYGHMERGRHKMRLETIAALADTTCPNDALTLARAYETDKIGRIVFLESDTNGLNLSWTN